MSDRDPEQDWNQPRPDFSQGSGPGTAGANPQHEQMTPLASSSWQRNRRAIMSLSVAVALCAVGLVVLLVMAD